MSRPFPYTYISCPCADTPVPDPARKRRSRESPQKPPPERDTEANEGQDDAKQSADKDDEEDEDEEQTFDPRSPRSNFSLYPPEQLLYCEDCHQIKCPRCITEEIVSWYCPNCLFETPSSMVRSDGGRYVSLYRSFSTKSFADSHYYQLRAKLLQLPRLYSPAGCEYH
jgi:dynactin-4